MIKSRNLPKSNLSLTFAKCDICGKDPEAYSYRSEAELTRELRAEGWTIAETKFSICPKCIASHNGAAEAYSVLFDRLGISWAPPDSGEFPIKIREIRNFENYPSFWLEYWQSGIRKDFRSCLSLEEVYRTLSQWRKHYGPGAAEFIPERRGDPEGAGS